MDTFRQAGDSLAGRYFAMRLHPISVREWCEQTGVTPDIALLHLLERGGFPEPCLADSASEAERWRGGYFTDLIREDILEFSRLHDINAMRLFAQTLQLRVGSSLSLASIARDMGVSPKTLAKYLEILEALFIVFTVRPWSRNITRATLLQPKSIFTIPAWYRVTLACGLKIWWLAICSNMRIGNKMPWAKAWTCITCAPKTGRRSILG